VKQLIINADDLGLTTGINRAVLELAHAGALTSATLMARAPVTEEAAGAALGRPSLGVGCHVVLTDGRPVLPPEEIPTLIDPRSDRSSGQWTAPSSADDGAPRFRPTLGAFVADLLRGRVSEAHIEAEAAAQIRRLQRLDLQVTHVDTHKHTHAFARVLRPLLRAAVLCNVTCVRNPFEPEWSVAAASGAGLKRRLQVRALNTQRAYFLGAVEHIGMVTTDGAVGVAATGGMTTETLRRTLHAMPEGAWELICHPGYCDASLRSAGTRLLESREIERDALLQVIPEIAASVSLIHFGQLKAASFAAVI
jgi:chitin disaccharide deacetylase